MKLKRMVKRLFAVASGATMLGATAMGALAADLSTYPSMFVEEGKFNGFFVVGESAASVDNLAMTDIAASMKTAKAGASTTTTVSGDAWKVGTSSKKFEMANTNTTQSEEQIYDIEQWIGKGEMAALADGQYSTTGSSVSYQQFLYFDVKNNNQNEIVVFAEDDNDVTADFFYVKSGLNLGEYVLEFSSAPESTIQNTAGSTASDGTVLDDMENTKITMLGRQFDIVLARRPQSKPEDSIKLTLMGGATRGSLQEGESTTTKVGDKSYDVTLTFVDTTYSKFTVNGETTDKLQVGDTFKLADGNEIGVAESLYQNYAGGVHSSDFFIGASKLELRDNDVTVLSSGQSTLKAGTETISGADVNIEGTDDNTTFTLSKVRVNMTAQDDYYVPAGGKLSTVIKAAGDDRELIFTNNWDIEYMGLTTEDTHDIKLDSNTDRKYNLIFYDGDNNMVKMPFLYATNNTHVQLSEEATEKDVVLNEALNISKNDYFVITGDSDGAGTYSGTERTYALQYKGADKSSATSPKIKFKNLGSGESLEYSIDTTSQTSVATLKLGGYSFAVNNVSAKSDTDFQLQIDLDGDGTIENTGNGQPGGGAEVDIYDNYGLRIDFGGGLYHNGTVDGGVNSTGGSDKLGYQINNTQPWQTNFTLVQMNWTIDDGNDYDNVVPAGVNLQADGTTTNELTVSAINIQGDLTKSATNPSKTPEGEENVGYGYTSMGAKWTYSTPTGSPNLFTLTSPKNQRLPQVYVTSGASASTSTAAGELVAVTVVDATKLDSEVADYMAQHLIVVGGPCVNTVAAKLLGSPAQCTEGFTPGKARVKLFEHSNGNVAMLVAGYSGADTRLAGKVVSHRYAELSGDEVEIEGTTYSDATIAAPTVATVTTTEVVAEQAATTTTTG